jgi:glucosamine-phosphate N-acetyltransferase
MNQLKHIGFSLGCYKLILDCTRDKVPFYEKAGFKEKEIQMALYKPEHSPSAKL